ncbi:Butyrate--CoA ligase AAE11- peroxisomal [Striga hermonthica]|uniref:Butyrate--CoA ligase AAE11- peroxisomal n=1 Tax=Striga hermonthica TaxID=68872 RepID=A0A9N7MS65_STRHE|nr:Butyrate--CoA ligase AAE11- peroxisomal [Striga hermonthica]
MDKLPKCGANYVPLTPLTFLKRAANVYSDRKSIIYGTVSFTWRQTYERCCRLASTLKSLNIAKNEVVSVLAPNIPALYEMHFAVPMAGAVLNAINTRLDARSVATILRHSETKLFFVDHQYIPVARDALRLLPAGSSPPLVAVVDDVAAPTGARLGPLEYEDLVLRGNPSHAPENVVSDEWDPITLNYTSGTTSFEPKGAVYSHRGAYLSTLSLILGWGMGTEPVYLWSLPMFHCNGWTFTWGVAARGGTNVCIRSTTANDILDTISLHKVTHMCCAPVVFNILLEEKNVRRIPALVEVLMGGSPPPAALLERAEGLGFRVTHAYGLTEATGPALVCEWQARWDRLGGADRARLKARQGISVLTVADVDVVSQSSSRSVPRDGKTMGEVVVRGSGVMKGYLKNEGATRAAFGRGDGWLHTGDVGVVHPDGYMEIKDRCKDVIISGGENVSSVEVEAALYEHPAVGEAAVVAMPHARWGESPCAFVVLQKGADEGEIVRHCREKLPGFMVPRKVVFVEELPRTSTGKVQKFQLRALARDLDNVSKSASSEKNHEIINIRPSVMPSLPMEDLYGRQNHEEQIFAMSRM